MVDNDVNVGTLAEHRAGAAQGFDDVLGVFVGTGVGGGLILDGKLRRGPSGVAGEIGHMVVRAGGRKCGCGGRGHLEAYAGRASMERRARELDLEGHDTALVELAGAKRMTSGVFGKALDAGDAVTIELLDEAVAALGTAIASVATVLDLSLVVVGGGLADRLGPAFVGRIEQAVRSELFAEGSALRVVPAKLGDQGGAIGAALVAGDQVNSG
jgi:glucokinase